MSARTRLTCDEVIVDNFLLPSRNVDLESYLLGFYVLPLLVDDWGT